MVWPRAGARRPSPIQNQPSKIQNLMTDPWAGGEPEKSSPVLPTAPPPAPAVPPAPPAGSPFRATPPPPPPQSADRISMPPAADGTGRPLATAPATATRVAAGAA